MASPSPAPPQALHTRNLSARSSTGLSSAANSFSATKPSMHTPSISRKRARNDSPIRDWQDLGLLSNSYGGPSPGFFNDVRMSPAPGSPTMASHSFFSPGMVTSSYASPGLVSPSFASPSPLAHSRYQLAGGQATPSMVQSSASDFFVPSVGGSGGESTSDLGYRRGRPYHDERNRSVSTFLAVQPSLERLPTALSRESNGQPRALPNTASLEESRLSQSVIQTVSGMVGRVWDFCTAGSFRGFFAGGGKGYAIEKANEYILPTPSESIWQDSAALPGRFPDSDPASAPSTPAAKRPKRTRFDDEDTSSMTHSWVMVRDASSASLSARRKSLATTASPASTRATPSRPALRRTSDASSVGHFPRNTTPHRPASAAGLRSPARSRMHSRQNSGVKRERRSSMVHNERDDPASTEWEVDSPIVSETAKFVKDMHRMERREDRDLRRMNRTLEDMIREAKEALGSTVEIEMMDDEHDDEMW